MKLVPVALLAAALVSSPALAATYVTDTAVFTGLGDTIGSPFDQIVLNSVVGTFNGQGTYLVNRVDFVVGINSTTTGQSSGSFSNSALVNGSNYTYTVPYTISIGPTDSIMIGGNAFNFGQYRVRFNTLTFSNVDIGTVSGDLTAVVSVPEPATWSLLIAGFGVVGYAMRRRQNVTVRYA